jgi:hypothetical protein
MQIWNDGFIVVYNERTHVPDAMQREVLAMPMRGVSLDGRLMAVRRVC